MNMSGLASKDEVNALEKNVQSMTGLLLDIERTLRFGAEGIRSSGSAYSDDEF